MSQTQEQTLLGEGTSFSRNTSSCHGGDVLFGGSCKSKKMVKFQEQCLLELQIISEYFVEVWPECCTRCAPFQLTKLEPSCAAGTQNKSYSSAISIMTSYQPGGVVVMGPHLLSGNFKFHCRKNSLFIVENLNSNHIDIYRHTNIQWKAW